MSDNPKWSGSQGDVECRFPNITAGQFTEGFADQDDGDKPWVMVFKNNWKRKDIIVPGMSHILYRGPKAPNVEVWVHILNLQKPLRQGTTL